MTDIRYTKPIRVGASGQVDSKQGLGIWLLLLFLACCQVNRSDRLPSSMLKAGFEQTGEASWYGPAFHGRRTASGDIFDQNELTAAHRTLPLGTKAEVTDIETGKSVQVTINDRGPYVKHRVIDLSKAAARKLGMTKEGTATVKIEAESTEKTKSGK